MKSLEPDVEEQALLAGISMFSPFLRKVRDHDDIHLLTKIQVKKYRCSILNFVMTTEIKNYCSVYVNKDP